MRLFPGTSVEFGTFKTESLHHYRFETCEQAKQVVFEYIEVFYNRIRRHAKIGNQIPLNLPISVTPQQHKPDDLPVLYIGLRSSDELKESRAG